MPDASPAKWHLAHTSWFFEEFIIVPRLGEKSRHNAGYKFLFNSYYETVGQRHPRNQRGMLTRPSLPEIVSYRRHIDKQMMSIYDEADKDYLLLLNVGIAHEEQHQELLLTDILNLFFQNPLKPALLESTTAVNDRLKAQSAKAEWVSFEGGQFAVGANTSDFHFDCEGPEHDVLLQPFKISSRCVSNRDWLKFIEDDGYENPHFWLADGYDIMRKNAWKAPLYWRKFGQEWTTMSLYGEMELALDAPVCHISYFEADAYAKWADARLPTEFEWEIAAKNQPVKSKDVTAGRDAQSPVLCPLPRYSNSQGALMGLYDDVWEWTASSFASYPRFAPSDGAIGEYNGKFMSGQMVLRGGSCATTQGHTRASYRNFFHPSKRWQFSGMRLAQDA